MKGKVQYFGPFSTIPRPAEGSRIVVKRNGVEEVGIYRSSYDMVAYDVGAETVPLMLYGSSETEIIKLI